MTRACGERDSMFEYSWPGSWLRALDVPSSTAWMHWSRLPRHSDGG
ncbi:hypothetical protein ACH4Q7_33510 [Streptomyces roseolus]